MSMLLSEKMLQQGNVLFKHRGKLPLILVICGFTLHLFHLYQGLPPISNYLQISAYIITLFGLAIRVYTVGYTRRGTSGRNRSQQKAESLNTDGMYSIVRHPLYLGNFLMWIGVCLLVNNLWFTVVFVLAFWLYYERICLAEEAFLQNKFKEAFLKWSLTTPIFIPAGKRWRRPSEPFNWRKVLLNEKNSLLAATLLFYLFDASERTILNGEFRIEFRFWFFSFLLSLILFSIVKLIQKNSLFLDENPSNKDIPRNRI